MKRWEIEAHLERVQDFSSSDASLEQYKTSADIAAATLRAMNETFDDVEHRLLADIGCGTGMLSIASALNGAGFIIAADIDEDALTIAQENAENVLVASLVSSPVDFIRADVTAGNFLRESCVDTSLMNPPFGTKRSGVDMAFLANATHATSEAVYSMHKTSTREYIQRKLSSWGASPQVVAEVRFDIGRTMQFHKAQSVDIAVDVWRIGVSEVSADKVVVAEIEEVMDSQNISRRGRGREHDRRNKGSSRPSRRRGRGKGR